MHLSGSVPMTFAIPIFPLDRLEFLAAELPTSSEFPPPPPGACFNAREQQSQAFVSSRIERRLVSSCQEKRRDTPRCYVFQRFRKRLARVLSWSLKSSTVPWSVNTPVQRSSATTTTWLQRMKELLTMKSPRYFKLLQLFVRENRSQQFHFFFFSQALRRKRKRLLSSFIKNRRFEKRKCIVPTWKSGGDFEITLSSSTYKRH